MGQRKAPSTRGALYRAIRSCGERTRRYINIPLSIPDRCGGTTRSDWNRVNEIETRTNEIVTRIIGARTTPLGVHFTAPGIYRFLTQTDGIEFVWEVGSSPSTYGVVASRRSSLSSTIERLYPALVRSVRHILNTEAIVELARLPYKC